MIKCEDCQLECATEAILHRHIRKHGYDMAIYYRKYHPRYDLLTGELINFVHKEQYMEAEFNTPENFRKWLLALPLDEAKDYCRSLLFDRKEKKNLIYTPSQVELRSLQGPSMVFMNKVFDDYYATCSEFGYQNKYHAFDKLPNNEMPYFVQIDTRERRLLPFEGANVEKLDFGDYRIHNKDESYNVYFERKSLGDFVGTLSKGLDRFIRELERAQASNNHLIIVIESPITEALHFNKLARKSFTTRTTPAYIFHNVRDIIQRFPMVQFLFVAGRKVAMKVMVRIYQMGEVYKECDLQYAYDKNLFNS